MSAMPKNEGIIIHHIECRFSKNEQPVQWCHECTILNDRDKYKNLIINFYNKMQKSKDAIMHRHFSQDDWSKSVIAYQEYMDALGDIEREVENDSLV